MGYKVQKVQKYALNSQLQALQILTNDDEVENWSFSSFLLAVTEMKHLSGTPLYVHINIPDVNVMRWLINTMGWDKTGNPV